MLLACVLPPSAAAAVPGPASVTNPILVSDTNRVIGQMHFGVGYDGSSATGIAGAAGVRLRRGRTYRLHTCVWAKAPARRPEARCQSRTTTVGLLGSLIGISAPTTWLQVARPAAGQPSATIAGSVIVDELRAGTGVGYASSWPYAGLPAAGIAVPAVDQLTGTVVPPQGTPVPGLRPGGIDSGAQDSICQGFELPATTPPRGSTDVLGALAAPYEVQEPTGTAVRGIMLLFHGGRWLDHGRGPMESMRGEADRWLARGWRTVNADHRACGSSVDDVVALYDRVLQTYGSARPICALGQSSGGHLALLLASLRPQIGCVVVEAGPADLTTLAGEGSASNIIPILLSNVTVSAFGADRLAQVSPTRLGVAARVLYGIGEGDPSMAWTQATAFAEAQRARDPNAYVDTMQLDAGDVPWVHVPVSGAALEEFHERELTLVEPLIEGPG